MRTVDRLAVAAAVLSAVIGVVSVSLYLDNVTDGSPAHQVTPSPTPAPTRPPAVTVTPSPPVPVQRIEIVVIPGTQTAASADRSAADWAGLLAALGAFLAGLGSLGAILVALRKAPGQPGLPPAAPRKTPGQPGPPPATPPQEVKRPEAG